MSDSIVRYNVVNQFHVEFSFDKSQHFFSSVPHHAHCHKTTHS